MMSGMENYECQTSVQGEVAIIGMACVFPKAPDLRTYWQNIVSKVDAIGDPPEDSIAGQVYDPNSTANDRIYCQRGGYIEELPPFDTGRYGVMPVAVDGAEPEHFMALKVADEALRDAGFPEKSFNRERTEVILGRGTFVNRGYTTVMQHGLILDQTLRILKGLHPEYSEGELARIKSILKEQLPPFTPETAPGLCHNLMAGIIANRLDLKGRTLVVDGACASCLLALEIGIDDLVSGKCDAVLIGGVQISTHAPIHMIFSQLGALSRSAHLRPFDRDADGTMLGEGIGMVVLKRLEDALKADHRIYAIVKGVGSSSDGRGKGLLAPRLEGEELALKRAYQASGVDPGTIELIEAHGTAIPLGDATEIRAMRNVFGDAEGGPKRCAIGTVKSMIGHLIPASGVAGLIKGALALYHKVLPPTISCENPNPDLELDKTPFYINTEPRPWIHGMSDYRRRAGVSSFGFGGINAHAVLEEFEGNGTPCRRGGSLQWESELLVVDADSRAELLNRCEEMQGRNSDSLPDLAHKMAAAYEGRSYRLAIVAESREDLGRKLKHAIERLREPNRLRIKEKSGIFFFEKPLGPVGKLAFLFPGEGSQYVNMLADLCLHFPEARRCFDLLDRAYVNHPWPPSRFLFPSTPEERQMAETRIWEMDGAVDAVTTADRALFQVLSLLGLRPDAVLGHSSGEFMALEAAGAVVLRDEKELVHYIQAGNRMIEALKSGSCSLEGRLLAVGGVERETVSRMVRQSEGFLVVAMDNCPNQVVLCGTEESTDRAAAEFREKGGICQRLPFHRPYHTERFSPALPALEEVFRKATVSSPSLPIYSCVTAELYPKDPEEIRRLAIAQWARPVRFRETIEAMYRDGVRVFLEVGPRANLTGFVRDILKGKPFLAISSNVHFRSGITQLNHSLGLLAAHGYSVNLEPLFTDRSPEKEKVQGGVRLSKSLPLFTHEMIAVAARKREGDSTTMTPQQSFPQGEPKPLSSLQLKASPQVNAPAAVRNPFPAAPRKQEKTMGEYLKTMEQFLETQEMVMLTYLEGQGSTTMDRDASHTVPSEQAADPKEQMERVAPSPDPAPRETHGIDAPEAHGIRKTPKEVLFTCVSDKTGYPIEMLSENQALEADLGIDSIKRVEIMGAVSKHLPGALPEGAMEKVSRFLTLGEILRFLEGVGATGSRVSAPSGKAEPCTQGQLLPEPRESSEFPLIGEAIWKVPGKEITARRRLSLRKDRFLQDHTLGGRVSQSDVTLLALPVMPVTMTLEMMAEEASHLFPGLHLVGMKEIKAHGWIILENEEITLEVTARAVPEGQAAQVHVRIVHPGEEKAALAAEGVMLFGPAFPEAPLAEAFRLQERQGSPNMRGPFYPEALFHGPSFQTVSEVVRCGIDGVEASLRVPSPGGLFQDIAHPRFLSNPVLLDGAGQAVGLWAAHCLETDFVIFPVGVSEIQFFSPSPIPEDKAMCTVHTSLEGDSMVISDVDLIDAQGKPAVRLRGLQHRRIRMPKLLHRFRGSRNVMLSSPWQDPLKGFGNPNTMVCCRFEPKEIDFNSDDGRIMREVIAAIVLSRRERQTWVQLKGTEKRRTEWLMARVAAKDAVRLLIKKVSSIDLWPADIDLQKDPHGAPLIRGAWIRQLDYTPAISLSHSGGAAIAIAGAGKNGFRLGIDMESLGSKEREFLQLAFSADERALLMKMDPSAVEEWTLRLWCAKEAVAKSLGRGLPGGPRDLSILGIDAPVGTVKVGLSGALARELPLLNGKPRRAFTLNTEGFVVAGAIYGEGDEIER